VRYLVTGGAGFIGSSYVRMLLGGDLGHATGVTVVDKLTYAGRRENLAPVADDPRLDFHRVDILDAGAEFLRGHDVVVHFAAESHVDRSIDSAVDFVTTNVVGTQRLLDAARAAEVGTFVHVSTDEVYGSIDDGSWLPDAPLDPRSPYAASKAGSDMLALAAHRTHGMDVRVTRCCNNYGPYQFPEKAIPLFLTRLFAGRRAPVYGDGLNEREWIHVEDHCRGIQAVLDKGAPGRVYTLSSGEGVTNLDLVARLAAIVGFDGDPVEFVTDRKGHDRRYSLDPRPAERDLGFSCTVDFDEGLRRTVAWYRDNRDWWTPLVAS
jgi:dTDP-glucose 4,6-dehydratase